MGRSGRSSRWLTWAVVVVLCVGLWVWSVGALGVVVVGKASWASGPVVSPEGFWGSWMMDIV